MNMRRCELATKKVFYHHITQISYLPDNEPPYKSSLVVKSISSSPDLASALPESIKGIAAGFNENRAVVILVVV